MGVQVNRFLICEDLEFSGVVVPGEVGILLIYAPNFFLNGSAKEE